VSSSLEFFLPFYFAISHQNYQFFLELGVSGDRHWFPQTSWVCRKGMFL